MRPRGLTPLFWFGIGLVTLGVGVGAGWIAAARSAELRAARLVAVSWGDGKYGPAFYGAFVYLVSEGGGYSVRARVALGRGNDSFHECGELGKVRTDEDAVARFGRVVWRNEGLYIGQPGGEYFLPRAHLERHR
jgi:hypothetical protein